MILKLKKILFNNSGTRQTVAKNFFWLFTSQIGTRLLRAFLIIYAARVLGVAEYGVFSYVIGLAGFFTVFADIGINTILTKEVAMNPEKSHHLFATSFWIKIFLLTFTVLLIIFVAPYFSKIEGIETLLYFAALLTIFDGIREFTVAFFRAREKMELEALVTTVTNVAITIFGFIILNSMPTAKALATAYAISAGTGTILGIFILRDQFKNLINGFRKELLAPILQLAWPIAIVSLAGIFMLNMDVIMLGALKTAKDVGLYSASQKIIQLLYTLPSILAISLFPTMAKFIGQNNAEKTREVMERGVVLSMLFAIPIVVGGFVLGSDIIRFLYGEDYIGTIPTFRILLLSVLLIFPGYHFTNYIMAYNKQKKMILIILMSSLANILLNYVLIPIYGAAGAAIATLGALLTIHGLSWRLAKKTNNFFIFRHLKKIFATSALMGLFSLALHWLGVYVLANIAMSVFLYFAVLLFLGENSIKEVKQLFKRA
ncbi:MAG: oligosaccharide flippase family protein [Patescibacteria group bacterium]